METDQQFMERMSRAIPYNSHLLKAVDLTRLFALARRGAAAIADDQCKVDPRQTAMMLTADDFLPPPPSGEPEHE